MSGNSPKQKESVKTSESALKVCRDLLKGAEMSKTI